MITTKNHTLSVSGATLFYRVRGTGPLLLILAGGHADADTTDALREQLIDRYTVVTYDRRGLSRSTIDAPAGSPTIATPGAKIVSALLLKRCISLRSTMFVGRSAEMSLWKQMLADGRCRLSAGPFNLCSETNRRHHRKGAHADHRRARIAPLVSAPAAAGP